MSLRSRRIDSPLSRSSNGTVRYDRSPLITTEMVFDKRRFVVNDRTKAFEIRDPNTPINHACAGCVVQWISEDLFLKPRYMQCPGEEAVTRALDAGVVAVLVKRLRVLANKSLRNPRNIVGEDKNLIVSWTYTTTALRHLVIAMVQYEGDQNSTINAAWKEIRHSAETIFQALRRCPYTQHNIIGKDDFLEHIKWPLFLVIRPPHKETDYLSLATLKAALELIIENYMETFKPLDEIQALRGPSPDLFSQLAVNVLTEIEDACCFTFGLVLDLKKWQSAPLKKFVAHCCRVVGDDAVNLKRRQECGDILSILIRQDKGHHLFKIMVENHAIAHMTKLLARLPFLSDDLPTNSVDFWGLPPDQQIRDPVVQFLGDMFYGSKRHGLEQQVVSQAVSAGVVWQLGVWSGDLEDDSDDEDSEAAGIQWELGTYIENLIIIAEKTDDKTREEILHQICEATKTDFCGTDFDRTLHNIWLDLICHARSLGDVRECKGCCADFSAVRGGRCSHGKSAEYCSKECQKRHWKKHRKGCSKKEKDP